MGNNVAAVIMTDFLDRLANDDSLGKALRLAISDRRAHECLPQGIKILPYHHADCTRIVAVGQNCITPIGLVLGNSFPHHKDEEARLKAAIAVLQAELDDVQRRKKRNPAA
jgi:hypothetical protein